MNMKRNAIRFFLLFKKFYTFTILCMAFDNHFNYVDSLSAVFKTGNITLLIEKEKNIPAWLTIFIFLLLQTFCVRFINSIA